MQVGKGRKEELVKVENGDEWVGEVTWTDENMKKGKGKGKGNGWRNWKKI